MKHQENAVWAGDLASEARINPLSAITSFVNKTLVITELEIRKLRHDFTELITRAIQPVLWLLLFGVGLLVA